MNNDEDIQLRLECLKLAYDINFKIGNLKIYYEKEEEIKEDLKDVFELSDMNFQYIMHGEHPSDDELEDSQGIDEI